MKIASVADVKARLSAYLKESQEGPVIVTRNGKAVAVLLAVTDEDELERLVLRIHASSRHSSTSPGARSKRPGGFPTTFSGARWKRKAVKTPARASNGNAEPNAEEDVQGVKSGKRFRLEG